MAVARFWVRIARCDFDYFSRVDIVSGADARGWPTNHLRKRQHCAVAAVWAGAGKMEKDKRRRAAVGRTGGLRDRRVGNGVRRLAGRRVLPETDRWV
jgi:hypothetical protein